MSSGAHHVNCGYTKMSDTTNKKETTVDSQLSPIQTSNKIT